MLPGLGGDYSYAPYIDVRQTGYYFPFSLFLPKKRDGEKENELAKPVLNQFFFVMIHLIIPLLSSYEYKFKNIFFCNRRHISLL